MNKRLEKPFLGITIGDINGIGPEVIIKTLADTRITQFVVPVIYGSSKVVSYYRKVLNIDGFNYNVINSVEKANPKRINILNCWNEDVNIQMGENRSEAGKYAFIALERACEDLEKDKIQLLVTAPINKFNIQQKGFSFPGHTEYLESKFKSKSLMLMVGNQIRLGLLTTHIPIKEVSATITKERIKEKVNLLEISLKNDFGISKPKIAILGLNPHAGDNGLLGSEEQKVIIPAIEELKNKGKLLFGPFSADSFFGSLQFQKFDVVLAMYHDQGLIPFKTLHFGSGVNFTAGLPIIRTSPDHGTAYDITGQNIADPSSMREAIFKAYDIWKNRNNPIP